LLDESEIKMIRKDIKLEEYLESLTNEELRRIRVRRKR